ncbi:SAP domain-containing protein, partial [Streptococcus pneumoniae]|uniref:SAP domain-containing protein n=1 Tax=Streptococcus pneumoniae TaxID=1313 RepID=UPI000AD60BCB
NFPRYFKYSLQIDPESTHNQLYKLGYFTKNKTLSYLTVVELKTILSKHNLATSGKKAELITRIINNVNIDNLDISNTRKAQGRHLEQEGNIKHALIYYIESLIITISGLENNFSATDYPVYYPDSIPDYSL